MARPRDLVQLGSRLLRWISTYVKCYSACDVCGPLAHYESASIAVCSFSLRTVWDLRQGHRGARQEGQAERDRERE
jgi:hypothetical protein